MTISTNQVFFAVLALLLFGNLIIKAAGKKRAQLIWNIIFLAAMAISAGIEMQLPSHDYFNVVSFNPFSLFFLIIFTLGMLLINLLAFAFSEDYGDFAMLSVFALVGMYLVSLSNSLITIFIGLELASIPAVFMLMLSKRSIESATKFFIMVSIAIAMLSFAIVLFYGGTGGVSLSETAHSQLLLFALMLFIASLSIDASVFPFNLLIPDIYEGSPGYLVSMLGGLNKKVAFAALIQVLILSFLSYKSAFMVVAILSVLTMFYGNIVAIMQKNLKRMLAYSSISQAGYIMIGIATATQTGISASLFLIFAHMFAFIGLFGVVAWLENKRRTRIEDLAGLSSENGLAAFAIALFTLSFVGMPFTTGFIGKFFVFLSAVNSGMLWLAFLGVLNSVISIFYYSKVILAAYSEKNAARRLHMQPAVFAAVIITLAITIVFGVYPQPLLSFANSAGAYLFRV